MLTLRNCLSYLLICPPVCLPYYLTICTASVATHFPYFIRFSFFYPCPYVSFIMLCQWGANLVSLLSPLVRQRCVLFKAFSFHAHKLSPHEVTLKYIVFYYKLAPFYEISSTMMI